MSKIYDMLCEAIDNLGFPANLIKKSIINNFNTATAEEINSLSDNVTYEDLYDIVKGYAEEDSDFLSWWVNLDLSNEDLAKGTTDIDPNIKDFWDSVTSLDSFSQDNNPSLYDALYTLEFNFLLNYLCDKYHIKVNDVDLEGYSLYNDEVSKNSGEPDESEYIFGDFNAVDFEKHLPDTMSFKFCDVLTDTLDNVDGADLYWVTQRLFSESDLRKFFEEFKNTKFKNAYVTVRDDSLYEFDKDYRNKVLARVTKRSYNMAGYGENHPECLNV